jgi:hypothetical protein
MKPEDYAVDNASLGTLEDMHPCGGWINGSHTWLAGRCEDCDYYCRHEDDIVDGYCTICGEVIDVEDE